MKVSILTACRMFAKRNGAPMAWLETLRYGMETIFCCCCVLTFSLSPSSCRPRLFPSRLCRIPACHFCGVLARVLERYMQFFTFVPLLPKHDFCFTFLCPVQCRAEKEVPNDKNLKQIFDGEEFSRGIRLWTHGTWYTYKLYIFQRWTRTVECHRLLRLNAAAVSLRL